MPNRHEVFALACAWIALCAASEPAASSSALGSGSGSSVGSVDIQSAFRDCRLRDRREVNAERGFSPREDNWTHEECFYVCPIVGHGQRECKTGHHGGVTFASHQRVMMWDVLFLILAVLVGALGKKFFPVWLPYTVGLLLIGCLVGGGALVLETRPSCPSFALDPVYDTNHDGAVTRSEWDAYACADCHNQSACASHDSRRSCYHWGCADFDELDAPFRYSFFDTQACSRARRAPSPHCCALRASSPLPLPRCRSPPPAYGERRAARFAGGALPRRTAAAR